MNQQQIDEINRIIKNSTLYQKFKLVFDILSKPLRDYLDRKFGK